METSKKSVWNNIIKLLVTILTAVATTLGVGAVLPKGEISPSEPAVTASNVSGGNPAGIADGHAYGEPTGMAASHPAGAGADLAASNATIGHPNLEELEYGCI